jgi:hypothetical protein
MLLSFVSLVEHFGRTSFVLAIFYARFTLVHRLLRDTRPLDGSTSIFWSYRRLHRPCGLLVTGVWLSSAREVFSFSSAWRSRSASFHCAKVEPGHKEADLLFSNSRGGACRIRAGLQRWQCTFCRLGLIFLLDVFVYSLVSMHSLLIYCSNFIGIFIVMGA